jgi:transcriptional coactivator p15 (PC4)
MAKKKSKDDRSVTTKQTIASWVRNSSGENVLVQLDQLGGRDVINVRIWHRSEDGNLIPSQKGITLVVDQLPKLARAVRKACKVARKRGLIA